MSKVKGIYGAVEVARMLGCSGSLVRNLAASGVAGFKVEGGRDWLFTDADVKALRLRSGGVPAKASKVNRKPVTALGKRTVAG